MSYLIRSGILALVLTIITTCYALSKTDNTIALFAGSMPFASWVAIVVYSIIEKEDKNVKN